MNTLFIFSAQKYKNRNKPINEQSDIQIGISYLSSILKSKGHNTELFIFTRETKLQSINKVIKHFQPNLICFTAVYTEYNFILKIARYLRAKYSFIYLLIGGVHISLNPEDLKKGPFDAACIGEGEYPILELIEQLEKRQKPTRINNLWFKNGKKIEKNPTRDFIQDLDSLPFPDREMWQKWINNPYSMHVILLGRGCPFQCTYCCNHVLKKISLGKYVRFRSFDDVLEEIKEILSKFPKTKELYFEIETIGANLKFAIDFCSKLEKFNQQLQKPLLFGVNLRIVPNINFEPLLRALKNSNFIFVNIGLESGSERIRKKILKRYYSNDDIIKFVRMAKKIGLKVFTYNMVGIPGETLTDFKKTIECNRKCLPNRVNLSIFFPYPGTVLYDICKEKGLLNHKIYENIERNKAIFNLEGFSKKQIQKEYEWFNYNIYKGFKPFYKTLGSVLSKKRYRHPIILIILYKLNTLYHYRIFFLFHLIWERSIKLILKKD